MAKKYRLRIEEVEPDKNGNKIFETCLFENLFDANTSLRIMFHQMIDKRKKIGEKNE